MESFAFNIAENVLERLASHAYQQVCLAWGVKVELHKLQDILLTITNVLQDAEQKQAKSRGLTEWIRKLKDVCYDIDDVLDRFEYEELRMRVTKLNRPSIKGKVRHLFLRPNSFFFNFKVGHEIKDIRARLVEIATQKAQFGLLELPAPDLTGVHRERETFSAVHAPDVIGRNGDKEKIIIHLLKNMCTGQDEDDESVSVISIYGLGGLGKTALAQLVYNDNRIMESFELRMWVCLSKDFNNRRLVREMIALATDDTCGDNESMEKMHIELKNGLKNKRFLLVMDDVWVEEPTEVTITKWTKLKTLLKVGANGSKIIVTTRTESVGRLMGSAYMHSLEFLPHSDCMSIFMKKAFATKRGAK